MFDLIAARQQVYDDFNERRERGDVGVLVPASTANIGPGYDAVGLAIDLPLLATVEKPGDYRVVSVGAGKGELPTGTSNAVWRGLAIWCERVGKIEPNITIRVHSAIPLEGGLGSSSAALVAGLALGRMLVGGEDKVDICELATELEGHPDNAVPAILGGLILKPDFSPVRRFLPRADLSAVIIHPNERMSTVEARRALPYEIRLKDAAANGARCAAVVASIAGFAELDPNDFIDVLHQPARFALMPTSGACVKALIDQGVPAFLSGAGPTVIALVDTSTTDDPLTYVRKSLSTVEGKLTIAVLPIDLLGVRSVQPL